MDKATTGRLFTTYLKIKRGSTHAAFPVIKYPTTPFRQERKYCFREMARKSLTLEKRVAQEFRKWLKEFPDQPTKLKAAAFDRIADEVLTKHDPDESTLTDRNGQ